MMSTRFVLSRLALLLAVALLTTSANAGSPQSLLRPNSPGSAPTAQKCAGPWRMKLQDCEDALRSWWQKTNPPPQPAYFPSSPQLLAAKEYLDDRAGASEFYPAAGSGASADFGERFGTHAFFKDQQGSVYHYDPKAPGKGRMRHMYRAWALVDSLKAPSGSPEPTYLLKRVDVNEQEAHNQVPFTNEVLVLAGLKRLVLPAGLSPAATPMNETAVLMLASSSDQGLHRYRAETCGSFSPQSRGKRCPAGTSAYVLQQSLPGASFDRMHTFSDPQYIDDKVIDKVRLLHRLGWMHPDLRASNVMVKPNLQILDPWIDNVDLIDFSNIQRIPEGLNETLTLDKDFSAARRFRLSIDRFW